MRTIKYYVSCIHYLDPAISVQHCFFYATSDTILIYSTLNKKIIRDIY